MSLDATPPADAALAVEARRLLAAGGCLSVRVEGSGDTWLVGASFIAPGPDGTPVTHAASHSGLSASTPRDPVYLAQRVLETLWRNERPGQTPPWETPPTGSSA